jgi:hypothetical protein
LRRIGAARNYFACYGAAEKRPPLIKHQETAKGFVGVEADMDDSCADETVPRSGSTI